MFNYISKPASIKKSQICKSIYSFSPFSFRSVKIKNNNIISLADKNILESNIKGFEPGSKEYINFSNNYFVRISEMDDLNFIFSTTKDTKKIRPVSSQNKTKIIKKGDICYQTASNVGNVCFYDGENAYYNSHIRKLNLRENKYYIYAILKSTIGKQQVDVTGSIKGVDNFREEYLLKTKIPFPTILNNPNPKDIENLVSLITQNIIDKEEKIKNKNKLIDKLIEEELKKNQKLIKFSFNYPKVSELKTLLRFDTGLYEKDFKKNDFLIKNYKNGYFQIPFKNITTGQTPQDYYYPKTKSNDNVFLWITPKNLKHNTLQKKLWIHTNKKNTIKNGDIIFGTRGTVGDLFFYDEETLGKVYINQSTSSIKIDGDLHNKIFVLCYFSSSIFKEITSKYIYDGTVPSITPEILTKFLIPNFSKEKQKQIADIYYKNFIKNNNLKLGTYLEKEKERNNKIGIFQLNMEVFILRDILENIIDKIIKEEKINISFDY